MNVKSRKRYTAEFKAQAVALLETGKPIAEVAQECKPRAKTPKRTSCEPGAARTSGYSKKTTS